MAIIDDIATVTKFAQDFIDDVKDLDVDVDDDGFMRLNHNDDTLNPYNKILFGDTIIGKERLVIPSPMQIKEYKLRDDYDYHIRTGYEILCKNHSWMRKAWDNYGAIRLKPYTYGTVGFDLYGTKYPIKTQAILRVVLEYHVIQYDLKRSKSTNAAVGKWIKAIPALSNRKYKSIAKAATVTKKGLNDPNSLYRDNYLVIDNFYQLVELMYNLKKFTNKYPDNKFKTSENQRYVYKHYVKALIIYADASYTAIRNDPYKLMYELCPNSTAYNILIRELEDRASECRVKINY